MKLTYGTDFHGNMKNIKKLLEIGKNNNSDYIIIGGDISPKKMSINFNDNIQYPYQGEDLQRIVKYSNNINLDTGYIPFSLNIKSENINIFQLIQIKLENNIRLEYSETKKLQNSKLLTKFFQESSAGKKIYNNIKLQKNTLENLNEDQVSDIVLNKTLLLSIPQDQSQKNEYKKILKNSRFKDPITNIESRALKFFAGYLNNICGGVETHLSLRKNIIRHQIDFGKRLVNELYQFVKSTNIEIITILGNDDSKGLIEIFNQAENEKIIHHLTNKTKILKNDLQIIGYSNVLPINTYFDEWFKSEEEIKKDLILLQNKINNKIKNTIFISHMPPINSNLSKIKLKNEKIIDIGSKAIKDFITKNQPIVSLHGHAHESPQITNTIKDKIKKTILINPGDSEYKNQITEISIKKEKVIIKKLT